MIADTALRLARYFGASVEMWMGLQADDDVEKACEAFGARLEEEDRPHVAWPGHVWTAHGYKAITGLGKRAYSYPKDRGPEGAGLG